MSNSPNTRRRTAAGGRALDERGGAARLAVKVVPRAKASEVVGWLPQRVLKVRVAAVPTDGAANAAVEELLARVLRVKRSQVRIVTGHTATRKIVEIDGVSRAALEAALGAPVGSEGSA